MQTSESPHYLASTFASSVAAESQSDEAARVRSAFAGAGFMRVSKLPSDLRCGAVLRSRTSHIVQNREMRPAPAKRIRSLQLFGVFQQPEHVPTCEDGGTSSPFQRQQQHQRRDRTIADTLSPKPPFVCAGSTSRSSKAPPVLLNDSHTLRQLSLSTITQESKLNQKATGLHDGDESTFLAGRFRTSSKVQEETRKGTLRDVKPIAQAIYDDLCKHWRSLKFTVASPDGRQIRVAIDEVTLELAGVREELLCGYLSALSNEGRLGDHAIFRDPSQWNVQEGDERAFAFWPEWERAAVMQQVRKQTAALQRSKARAYGKTVRRPQVVR